jgi:hypothetical protein
MTLHTQFGAAVAAGAMALAVASPAHAQQPGTSTPRTTFEITPRVAFGSAGSTDAGAAVRMPIKGCFSLELDTALRHAEINGLTTSVSVLYDLPSLGRATPYLAAGVGLEQYGTAAAAPSGGLVTRHRTAFTLNAGGGVRVALDDRWGLRSDLRWSNGIGRDAPERWRLYNGVTLRATQR